MNGYRDFTNNNVVRDVTKNKQSTIYVAKKYDVTELVIDKNLFDEARELFNSGSRQSLTIDDAATLYQIDQVEFRAALVEDALERNSLNKFNDDNYLSLRKCADTFDLAITSLKRMKLRKNEGTDLFPKSGPKPAFSEVAAKEIFRPYQQLTSKTKVTKVQMGIVMKKAFIDKDRSNQLFGPTVESSKLSKYRVNKIIDKYLPESIKNPTMTNERREIANGDTFNFVSNAVVITAMLDPTPETEWSIS